MNVRLASLLAVCLLIVGCGNRSIVGMWDAEYSSDEPKVDTRLKELADFERTMEFREDGTAAFKLGGQTVEGKYEQRGNTITFTAPRPDGTPNSHNLTLSNDGSTMTGVMKKVKMQLTRPAS